MDSLVAYEAMVEGLARHKSDELISNRCSEHAAVLIKHLFLSANQSVLIFSGSLNRAVYGRREIVEAARDFIGRGGEIRVVIQKPVAEEELLTHEFLDTLLKDCPGAGARFVVHIGGEGISKVNNHFIVADRTAYRFEKDTTTHEAFASFNDPEIGTNLSELFKALEAASTEVSRKSS